MMNIFKNDNTEEPAGKLDKSIEADLKMGLLNAEIQNENNVDSSGDSILAKPVFIIPDFAVKLFCDIKNSIEIKYITKDLDDDIKEAVKRIFATTDKEIKIYKLILEMVGENYLPEEHKEWVSKILASPLLLAVELETEKIIHALKEIKLLVNQKNLKGVA